MRKFILSLIFTILSISAYGQEYTKKELEYKPKNFEEALIQLDKIFTDDVKDKILSMTEDEFIRGSHMGTGLWIRNNWLYKRFLGFGVGQSALRKELEQKGFPTNDDMSVAILRSYHRRLNNRDIELEEQAKKALQWYLNNTP